MIGDIALIDMPRKLVLSQAIVGVTITDDDNDKPTPWRLTIADATGAMIDLGNVSRDHVAVWLESSTPATATRSCHYRRANTRSTRAGVSLTASIQSRSICIPAISRASAAYSPGLVPTRLR